MLPWVYESIKNYASLLKKSCISHSTPQVCLDRDGFLFKRKKSHVSATTGFAVYVTGFCLNISESNCQHWCLKVYFVLSVFRTHISIKPQSCRKAKLSASSLTWLGFYSDITPRCDWRFIKTQKLEVEKIARSPAPFPARVGYVAGVSALRLTEVLCQWWLSFIIVPGSPGLSCGSEHCLPTAVRVPLLSSSQTWDITVWNMISCDLLSRRLEDNKAHGLICFLHMAGESWTASCTHSTWYLSLSVPICKSGRNFLLL